MNHSYEILPSPPALGPGWLLFLRENGSRVAEVRFSIGDDGRNVDVALELAYDNAQVEASDWLNSRNFYSSRQVRPYVTPGLELLPFISIVILGFFLLPVLLSF